MTWRAFIGEWPGDYRTELDLRGVPWGEARAALQGYAQEGLRINSGADGGLVCPVCQDRARTSIAELEALPEGETWEGDIDWDELFLLPEGAVPARYAETPGRPATPG
jgi:hypothetical protein